MNLKGHTIGGVISSSVITGAIYFLDKRYPALTLTQGQIYPIVFSTTFFMSLFPDLDVQSVPQRWFYRLVFVLMGALIYFKEFQCASAIGFLCLIPILDHHRGITHNWLICIFLPWVLLFAYLYRSNGMVDLDTMIRYSWYAISCSFGWMTHLLLDFKKITKGKGMRRS